LFVTRSDLELGVFLEVIIDAGGKSFLGQFVIHREVKGECNILKLSLVLRGKRASKWRVGI
jgi:hypothetical protein